jgi:hypothetical protein
MPVNGWAGSLRCTGHQDFGYDPVKMIGFQGYVGFLRPKNEYLELKELICCPLMIKDQDFYQISTLLLLCELELSAVASMTCFGKKKKIHSKSKQRTKTSLEDNLYL